MQTMIESDLWHFVHSMGPVFWHVKSACAGLVFVLLFFQSWNVSTAVLATRYLSMAGAFLIACASWGNSALGPLGDILFWPSFAAYHMLLVWKLMPALRARMETQPPSPEKVIWLSMTGQLARSIKHRDSVESHKRAISG